MVSSFLKRRRIVAVNVDEFGAALDRETLGFGQRGGPRALSEMNR
jgi:hypothetical protein